MYTKIDELIWTDIKYKKLSDDGKFLFLYVISCPHRNMLGFYFLPIPYGSFDLNWTNERFSKGLEELLRNGFINYDFDTSIIFVKNFLKYNSLENKNQVTGAIKALDSIPPNGIVTGLLKYLKGLDKEYLEPLIKRLEERLAKGLAKQEEEEEEEEEKEEVKEQCRTSSKFDGSSIEYQLAQRLYEKILLNDSKTKKPNLNKWAEHINKLIRIDKRDVKTVESVIDFATSDNFWKTNILSANKLREKFQQLYLKMNQGTGRIIKDQSKWCDENTPIPDDYDGF